MAQIPKGRTVSMYFLTTVPFEWLDFLKRKASLNLPLKCKIPQVNYLKHSRTNSTATGLKECHHSAIFLWKKDSSTLNFPQWEKDPRLLFGLYIFKDMKNYPAPLISIDRDVLVIPHWKVRILSNINQRTVHSTLTKLYFTNNPTKNTNQMNQDLIQIVAV